MNQVLNGTKNCQEFIFAEVFMVDGNVLFRLLYSCGLRTCEARKLLVKDVDLVEGQLFIRNSKGPKDRMVWLGKDMVNLCRKYHTQVSRIYLHREFFFPSLLRVISIIHG